MSGSSIAMHSLYPIGFWRLTLINLKIRLTHLGLLLVVLAAFGAILLFRNVCYFLDDFLQILVLAKDQSDIELLCAGATNQVECKSHINTFFLRSYGNHRLAVVFKNGITVMINDCGSPIS